MRCQTLIVDFFFANWSRGPVASPTMDPSELGSILFSHVKESLGRACQGKGFLLCYKRGDEAVHGEHHLTLVA